MGFLKDLAKLTELGTRSYNQLDVKGRLADAQAQLDALNAPFGGDPAADARRVPATATVLSSTPTGMVVNHDTVVAIELLVMHGGVPVPVRTQAAVSPVNLGRVAPGSALPVSIDPIRPTDPGSLRITWA